MGRWRSERWGPFRLAVWASGTVADPESIPAIICGSFVFRPREELHETLSLLSIRARLTGTAVMLVLVAGALLLIWSVRYQRQAAIAQAQDFAYSAHQMTVSGLTAMMLVGRPQDRNLFLDQIEQSRNVRSLRISRGEPVVRQFGPGTAREAPLDAVDLEVLRTGSPHFEVVETPAGDYLRAVLPAVASKNYLGKNCLACHAVSEGAILGAVSMEISLDVVDRVSNEYAHGVVAAAILLLVPLGLLMLLAITRLVTRPLNRLTQGLRRIAATEDALEQAASLPTSDDEVGLASAAFNQVMNRFGALARDLRLSKTVFDNAHEAIVITDRNAVIQKVNSAFSRITGYPEREVVGRTPAILKSGEHPQGFYELFWDALLNRGFWRGEIRNRRKDGSLYTEGLSAVAVRDASGEISNFIGIFGDITERKLREDEIAFQAFHDPLTSLPNRLTLLTRLDQAVALAQREDHGAPTLMYIDMDGFKDVNDSYGHETGDRVLIELACRLKRALRGSDTVARVGGDEFVVLLPETSDPEALRGLAEKLLRALREPIRIDDGEIALTASMGLASFPADGTDSAQLMAAADRAMYGVKGSGRNAYRL